MKDLTQGSLSGHLLAMSLQMALGLLLQTLYFFVDLYFVARLGNASIAGVSAAGNVTFIVIAMTQALGVATVSLVSHAVGRKDQAGANHIFNQSVSMAVVATVVLLVGGYGFADAYMNLFAADADTAREGLAFLHGYLPGMALQFASVVMGSGLRGTGIVKPTMIVQALSVLLNTALAPVLIAGWGTGRPLGALGAGLATSGAVAVGVVLLTLYFVRLEHYVHFDPKQWKPRLATWSRMLQVGIPAGGEFLMLAMFTAVAYWAVRRFGADAQAGYGIGGRINQMLFVPAMAIAFSAAPVGGQNFGARRADRVRETFRVALLYTTITMALLTVLVQWKADTFALVFTDHPGAVAVASELLHYVSWNFVCSGIVFCCSSLFQAMGNTWPSLASSGLRLVIFALPGLWMAQQPWFEMHHLFTLSVATTALQALVSCLLLRWQFRERLDKMPARAAVSPGPA